MNISQANYSKQELVPHKSGETPNTRVVLPVYTCFIVLLFCLEKYFPVATSSPVDLHLQTQASPFCTNCACLQFQSCLITLLLFQYFLFNVMWHIWGAYFQEKCKLKRKLGLILFCNLCYLGCSKACRMQHCTQMYVKKATSTNFFTEVCTLPG